MACFKPLKAFRSPGGGVQFSGTGSASLSPLELPCGQCIGCRVDRSRAWAVRCVHESMMHDRSCFITLTYSGACVPADVSVNVREWQLFAKKLRKRIPAFRYFACGEYGDESRRPHYHACLFGYDFSRDREVVDHNVRGEPLFTSKLLESVWEKGMVRVGALTYESAAYVARYVVKKATRGAAGEEYRERVYTRYNGDTGECWDVNPEFVVMSRNPGLGSAWFDKYMSDVYPSDEVVLKGRRFRPPRFYDDKLPEETLGVLKDKRAAAAARYAEENSEARLRVREEFANRLLASRERFG